MNPDDSNRLITQPSLSIRIMEESDFEAVDGILREAFRFPGSRKEELRRYLALQPDGWFVAELDKIPVGTGGFVDYGEFAWIGLMGVHSSFQSRGIGRFLMKHLLSHLGERKVPMIVLDASPAGKPLYDSLHFIGEGHTSLYELHGKTIPDKQN